MNNSLEWHYIPWSGKVTIGKYTVGKNKYRIDMHNQFVKDISLLHIHIYVTNDSYLYKVVLFNKFVTYINYVTTH